MMLGLKLGLEGLYFNTFRKPTTTSLIQTYLVPPYTTIRGMLSNALGLRRDDLALQDRLRIGIKPIALPDKSWEMAKILKLISREMKFECQNCKNKWITETKPKKCPNCNSDKFSQIPNYQKRFPSSPMFKEFLTGINYQIYLTGEDDQIRAISQALENPARPLYLGASDEFVDVQVSKPMAIKETTSKEVSSILEGIQRDCIIEKIPYKFIKEGKKSFYVEYKTVSIPTDGTVRLDEEIAAHIFDGEVVWVG